VTLKNLYILIITGQQLLALKYWLSITRQDGIHSQQYGDKPVAFSSYPTFTIQLSITDIRVVLLSKLKKKKNIFYISFCVTETTTGMNKNYIMTPFLC
jgi:hypothetical protein